MAGKVVARRAETARPVVRASQRTTSPASVVGVALTISEKALAELGRIQ